MKKDFVWAAAGIYIALGALALAATAQNPDTLMPEQSAAKAKALIQQVIAGLGGAAYLNVRDQDCTGKLSVFGHSGELIGFSSIRDLWKFPDKHRTDYAKQDNVIDIFAGKEGWTLDRAGVHEEPEEAVANFQEGLKRSVSYLLRYRMAHEKEEGLTFRYAGGDIIDLKPVEWVEVTDGERRMLRIAIDRNAHVPIRSSVATRDPEFHDRMEEITLYSTWHSIDGVQIAFQTSRERNGQKTYQLFLTECKCNTGLGDEMFTRAALEKRWSEVKKK